MNINLEIRGLSEAEQLLNAQYIVQAISRALNRAAKAAFTLGSKEIRKEYNIKAADIKKAAQIKPATFGSLQAVISISGGPIPFKYFGARQTKQGVTVKIKKSGKRTLIKGAFIGGYIPIRQKTKRGRVSFKMVNVSDWGGGHVFIRKGKSRLPIVKMATTQVTIPKLFQSRRIWPVIERKISETFKKEFWHNYYFYLSRRK
jgi:hypothetical protein